jgi:hypothetical protein
MAFIWCVGGLLAVCVLLSLMDLSQVGCECPKGMEMRTWSMTILTRAARGAAIAAAMMAPLCSGQALTPSEALNRHLTRQRIEQPTCFDSVFAVQIDASLPSLKKQGSMTGLKRVVRPGYIIYRGLRYTGDNFVKNQVIARFLARETNPPAQAGEIAVTRLNYVFAFDRASEYNGLIAYVFLLKPRRKRAGLFRGELWLDANTATPLRLWGDFVKSPSIFVRSVRFVQDYQSLRGCTEPLRLLVTARTLIAGTVELAEWMHPASGDPTPTPAMNPPPDFKHEGQAVQ